MEAPSDLTLWDGQVAQVLVGGIAIAALWSLVDPQVSSPQQSVSILGLGPAAWFAIALLLPYLHQVVIAPLWRWELLDQGLTKLLGSTDRAFILFRFVFAIFFLPRLVISLPVALLTREQLPETIHLVLAIAAVPLLIIALYGMYSVVRYFGISRAFGADHFYQEYRELPPVDQGLFAYTSNAMYTYVLAITWLPALFLGSTTGLIAGLFNHLFVWVHYFLIEKPDMAYIYE